VEREKSGFGADLEDAEVVHRYLQIENRPGGSEDLDPEVEAAWFALGDQESWIESRPRAARSWETPHRP
jgi:hypothetical protein